MGNTKGWILAAIVLLAEAGIVYSLLSIDNTTPPTAIGRDPAALGRIALPVDPRTIVRTDQPGDAGALYRLAADIYERDQQLYEGFNRTRDREQLPRLAALNHLRSATHLKDGAIFAATPEAVVVYGDSAPITALAAVGKACYLAGQAVEKEDPALARGYYEAAFSLGMRLCEERLTYRQFSEGVTLMSESAARLAENAKKTNRTADLQAATRFADGLRDYVQKHILPTIEAIYTLNETKIARHAGDVFAFARQSEERLWRVEAVLKLGRMRFNAGVPGRVANQRQAGHLAEQLADNDPDPIIRRAAALARDLPVEEFRMLR